MTFAPESAAAALMGARRRPDRAPMAPLPSGIRPTTVAEGAAAQLALAQLTDQAAPGGFKVGATTAQMQAYLGLDGPAAGFMPRDNLHASGSTLRFDRFLRPGVECELAVHLAHDLSPGPCTEAEAMAAVDLLMPAIEIVENRYADLAAFGAPSLVADQAFHAGAVLGAPVADWRILDLVAIPGHMTVDGTTVGQGRGGDLMGHPLRVLAWLAESAEVAAFGGLRAGQVVMLGSVTPPIWLERPGRIEVRFGGLAPVALDLV